jgi:hypothetical protein
MNIILINVVLGAGISREQRAQVRNRAAQHLQLKAVSSQENRQTTQMLCLGYYGLIIEYSPCSVY